MIDDSVSHVVARLIERMLQIQGSAFDRSFVRKSLTDMLGESDTRVEKWDAICGRNPADADG